MHFQIDRNFDMKPIAGRDANELYQLIGIAKFPRMKYL